VVFPESLGFVLSTQQLSVEPDARCAEQDLDKHPDDGGDAEDLCVERFCLLAFKPVQIGIELTDAMPSREMGCEMRCLGVYHYGCPY
jgi:hypothetical protein